MSRTVRTLDLFRIGVAGGAAVVLLTACGGGGSEAGSATTTPAAGQSEEGTAAADGAADFCAQAAGIDQRVDSALSHLEGGDPSVADAFRSIATELRGIEAPEAITSDWEAMAAGLDRMADAFAGIDDITDLDSIESLDRAEGDLTAASTNVDDYLSDECGL
jgi:ABC-type glycerol-3-phosphate transport system substrate-binding protein